MISRPLQRLVSCQQRASLNSGFRLDHRISQINHCSLVYSDPPSLDGRCPQSAGSLRKGDATASITGLLAVRPLHRGSPSLQARKSRPHTAQSSRCGNPARSRTITRSAWRSITSFTDSMKRATTSEPGSSLRQQRPAPTIDCAILSTSEPLGPSPPGILQTLFYIFAENLTTSVRWGSGSARPANRLSRSRWPPRQAHASSRGRRPRHAKRKRK